MDLGRFFLLKRVFIKKFKRAHTDLFNIPPTYEFANLADLYIYIYVTLDQQINAIEAKIARKRVQE